MDDHLPPDPYLALGVSRDAAAAAIKSQYRKLALKFHPDKVQDAGQKQTASDQFHKIQTAYEIVGDDDRRQRYDAQVRLADLRREMMAERHGGNTAAPRSGGGGGGGGGVETRTAGLKVPTQSTRGGDFYAKGPERSGRVSPLFEERRPSFAAAPPPTTQTEYADLPPRATSRKDPDHDRPSKRSSPRDDRERTRAKATARDAKENERSSRREKSRRSEQNIRRERDRKQPLYATVENDSSSDSDPYERRQRMRDEDLRRARESYYDQARKQSEEATNGYFADERARKLFSQQDGVRDYIERSARSSRRPESERRPSPTRRGSSREKVEYIKRKDGAPPVMIRRGSGRPKTTGQDSEARKPSSAREREPEIVDEPVEPRRPSTLNQSRSSPEDIRVPLERQRSKSAQVKSRDEPAPRMRRADTMPTESKSRDSRRSKEAAMPSKGSGHRNGGAHNIYPTPEHSPEPVSRRYHYGQEYADDKEYATPDGYRTDLREPNLTARQPRYTRSPSPTKDRSKDRAGAAAAAAAAATAGTGPPPSSRYASASSLQPPQMSRTTSKTYVYADASPRGSVPNGASGAEGFFRPTPSRENSGRSGVAGGGSMFFRDIPTDQSSRSPKLGSGPTPSLQQQQQQHQRSSPPLESVQYQREIRAEDIKFQTGPPRRRNKDVAASYGRGSSGNPIYAQ